MGISITSGRGREVRNAVLQHFAANPEAVLTCLQLFDIVDTVEHRTDLADALRQMVASGDLALGDERQPGEPGGMSKGAGARAVKAYRLPSLAPAEAEKLESVLVAELEPETLASLVEQDPLFAVIDQLPIAVRVPDGAQRAVRLRRLAGRLEASAPDLAADLYENATILEYLAA